MKAILKENSITIKADSVSESLALRYLFRSSTIDCCDYCKGSNIEDKIIIDTNPPESEDS